MVEKLRTGDEVMEVHIEVLLALHESFVRCQLEVGLGRHFRDTGDHLGQFLVQSVEL